MATVYFLPGFSAGAAIDIPAGMQSGEFKAAAVDGVLFDGWLCWVMGAAVKRLTVESLVVPRSVCWLTPLISAIGGGAGGA